MTQSWVCMKIVPRFFNQKVIILYINNYFIMSNSAKTNQNDDVKVSLMNIACKMMQVTAINFPLIFRNGFLYQISISVLQFPNLQQNTCVKFKDKGCFFLKIL